LFTIDKIMRERAFVKRGNRKKREKCAAGSRPGGVGERDQTLPEVRHPPGARDLILRLHSFIILSAC
jgi:hypothetical protein